MPKTEAEPQSGVGATPGGRLQNSKQLMEHIRNLEADRAKYLLENKVLESKLRGYQTLGNLLQDAKQEVRKYQAHNEELMHQLASLTSSQSSTPSKTTPTSPVSPAGDEALPGNHADNGAQGEASAVPKEDKEGNLPKVAKLNDQKLMISSVDSYEIYGAKNKESSSNESSTISPLASRGGQSVANVRDSEVAVSNPTSPTNAEPQMTKEPDNLEKLSIASQPSDDIIFQDGVVVGGQEPQAETPAGSTAVKGVPEKEKDSGFEVMGPPGVSGDPKNGAKPESRQISGPIEPVQAWPAVQPRLPSFDDTWEVSGCLTVDSAVFDDEFCVEITGVSDSSSEGTPAGSLSLPHFRSSSCSSSSIQPASPSDPETSLGTNLDNPRSHDAGHEANVSIQVQDLTKVLSDAVGLDTTSDLAPKLTRISLDILRMEKHLKTCQTLIENLSNENERLKVKLHVSVPEKDRLNAALRIENDMLLNKVRLLERERDEMPPVRESSPSNGWVHVNNQQQQHVQQGAAEGDANKADASGLQQKYETLQNKVQELSKANEKWVSHCDQMKVDFERQVQTLQRDLALSRSQLAEKEEQEKKRQNDIDRILLAAKKRAEDAEAAREEALNSLHVERQRRAHFEELHTLEMQRCVELEERVSQMETRQADQAVAGGAPSLMSTTVSGLDSLAIMTAPDLRTEVQVLRQQILIYKDDFDTERRDREKAQHELEDVKNKLTRFKLEHNQEQRRVVELSRELERVKEENTQLEVDLATKREDIARLEAERKRMYPAPQRPPAVPPTWNPSSNVPASGLLHKWNCTRCTYENIPQRTTCELCGKGKVPLNMEGWKCPSCTYLNPAGQYRCSICDHANLNHPADPWRQNLMRERAGHRQLISRGGEECDQASRVPATPRYSGYSPMQNPTDDLMMDSLVLDDPSGRK